MAPPTRPAASLHRPRLSAGGGPRHWDQVVDTLRAKVRNRHGRADEPSAAILDSQSVSNAGPGDQVGYDAGKGIRGRKRPVLVDSLGVLIAVAVTSAYVSDVAGGHQLVRRARLTNSLLGLVWCDSAYQGLAAEWPACGCVSTS
jgi:hypothetical protein